MKREMRAGEVVVTARFRRAYRDRKVVFEGERVAAAATTPEPEPARRPSRKAIMLALAWKIRWAIDEGRLANQSEAARRLGVSRARVSQLLGLTLMPVARQEAVLLGEVGGRRSRLSDETGTEPGAE